MFIVRSMPAWRAAAGALLLPVALTAAAAEAPAARPDPLDAGAAVPALVHDSTFRGYRSWSEQDPAGWREANDVVGRVGGWRAYAREAAAPGPAQAAGAETQRSGAQTQPAGAEHHRAGARHDHRD